MMTSYAHWGRVSNTRAAAELSFVSGEHLLFVSCEPPINFSANGRCFASTVRHIAMLRQPLPTYRSLEHSLQPFSQDRTAESDLEADESSCRPRAEPAGPEVASK